MDRCVDPHVLYGRCLRYRIMVFFPRVCLRVTDLAEGEVLAGTALRLNLYGRFGRQRRICGVCVLCIPRYRELEPVAVLERTALQLFRER